MKIIQTLSTKTREIKWKQLRIHNYTCIHICKKMKLCKRGDINKLDYYFLVFFFRPLAQSRRLYIVLSKIWLHRRLIKVKGVAFPLWRAIDNCWHRKVDLWVRLWLMWPVCQFPGQAQQPSDSRYLLFLWQLGRRCACRPVHHTWRFCWLLPGWPLHLPLWQCPQCVILHKCLEQWHPRPLVCLWTMGSMCCHLGTSHFAEPFAGSFVAGIYTCITALNRMSFMELCRCCLGELLRQERPWCSPRASTGFPQMQVYAKYALQPTLWATASQTASSDSLRPIEVVGGACSQSPEWLDDAAKSGFVHVALCSWLLLLFKSHTMQSSFKTAKRSANQCIVKGIMRNIQGFNFVTVSCKHRWPSKQQQWTLNCSV